MRGRSNSSGEIKRCGPRVVKWNFILWSHMDVTTTSVKLPQSCTREQPVGIFLQHMIPDSHRTSHLKCIPFKLESNHSLCVCGGDIFQRYSLPIQYPDNLSSFFVCIKFWFPFYIKIYFFHCQFLILYFYSDWNFIVSLRYLKACPPRKQGFRIICATQKCCTLHLLPHWNCHLTRPGLSAANNSYLLNKENYFWNICFENHLILKLYQCRKLKIASRTSPPEVQSIHRSSSFDLVKAHLMAQTVGINTVANLTSMLDVLANPHEFPSMWFELGTRFKVEYYLQGKWYIWLGKWRLLVYR